MDCTLISWVSNFWGAVHYPAFFCEKLPDALRLSGLHNTSQFIEFAGHGRPDTSGNAHQLPFALRRTLNR